MEDIAACNSYSTDAAEKIPVGDWKVYPGIYRDHSGDSSMQGIKAAFGWLTAAFGISRHVLGWSGYENGTTYRS